MKHFSIFLSALMLFGVFVVGYQVFDNNNTQDSTVQSVRDTEVEKIYTMFLEGFSASNKSEESNTETDMYGAALIQTAMERFASCPEAASKIVLLFEDHTKQASPIIRYGQWSLLLDSFDTAVNHCDTIDDFRRTWADRSKITDKMDNALIESVSEMLQVLNQFYDKINEIDNSTTRFNDEFKTAENEIGLDEDKKEILDILISEGDDESGNISEATIAEIGKLRQTVTKIAQTISGKHTEQIEQISRQLEEEKRKDMSDEIPPEAKSSEEIDAGKPGSYQKIREEIDAILTIQNDSSIAYWSNLLSTIETTENENEPPSQIEKLITLSEESRRLQHIRYNLWVTWQMNNYSTIDLLAKIDTGLLFFFVDSLYREKENKIMSEIAPQQRVHSIRTLLLTPKIPLEAF